MSEQKTAMENIEEIRELVEDMFSGPCSKWLSVKCIEILALLSKCESQEPVKWQGGSPKPQPDCMDVPRESQEPADCKPEAKLPQFEDIIGLYCDDNEPEAKPEPGEFTKESRELIKTLDVVGWIEYEGGKKLKELLNRLPELCNRLDAAEAKFKKLRCAIFGVKALEYDRIERDYWKLLEEEYFKLQAKLKVENDNRMKAEKAQWEGVEEVKQLQASLDAAEAENKQRQLDFENKLKTQAEKIEGLKANIKFIQSYNE